jgi:CheY-like chemotaxis protein/CHASE3 domain sensor protein
VLDDRVAMNEASAVPVGRRSHRWLPLGAFAGLFAAALAVGLIAFFSSRASARREGAANRMTHTLEVLQHLQAVLSLAKDAETGQRGYLLTAEESYLEPYTLASAALPGEMRELERLLSDNAAQLMQLQTLRALVAGKLEELRQTIELRRAGQAEQALSLARSDRGREAMVRIRDAVEAMQIEERALLTTRQGEWRAAVTASSYVTWGGSNLLLVLIVLAGFMMSRDYRARENQIWLRSGQMAMATVVQGEQRLEVLGGKALELLARYLEAQAGALYLAQADGFRRVAAFAAPADGDLVRPGDGLLGQAARDRRPLHVRDVPAGYLPVSSALGQARATELLIAPATVDGVVQAVVELAFFRRVRPDEVELLDRVSESLGVAVRASKDRSRLEELLGETQRQAEELQTQQEELRVSNEELEEQSRVLKESQARLESQQGELEQINTQLEAQTQLLEAQKEDLAQAQAILTDRAEELERANQYKSEFLANMSHELRTPLNSSLILAKLLADNKDGNLSDEQVRFAQTIFSAGRDLLDLINDILDLSRIEAGRMELSPEPVPIAATVDGLVEGLSPLAAQKGLAFTATVEPGTPERIETDAQRLGQILKNLLSNAIKFTEAGGVSLRASAAGPDAVAFVVRDTGIGIPAHQQAIIFEAFRQADGSTHRKYGGTGLGLSISRDLARLLGGDIALTSTPGSGSVFTLTLPVTFNPAARSGAAPAIAAAAPPPRPAASAPPPAPAPALARPEVNDDRDHLTPDARRILVIEDDVSFARILRDLAHELGFECVVTHTAGDGIAAAAAYRPSAIVLDMNLPDHSGLGVLDRLKHDAGTRHVPVHVVSVADYRRQALERGAIGYALKPVQRDELVEAFRRMDAKVAQAGRRVLVVEDDARQRESVQQLLGSDGVQIEAVETAAQALDRLRDTTFDCMVMDLNLPDMSGYDLLERMAEQDEVAFPPVIVYTGRVMTRDEEQGLRRFSRSIIVKDARSPERLLDEVTLFLHQVESTLPVERQRMLKAARHREKALEGRRVLVVEDDARNIFALSNVLEPKGAAIEIARNGREAIEALERSGAPGGAAIDLVLMDIMMPEMDGLTAMREIRQRPQWARLPIIALTAKAMKDDQERCLAAGASDYIAKPLDVEQLLSLVRVWMPK